MRGQARADATGDELDERRVREDQAVAERLILRLPVLLPERLGLGRSHGKRIRRAEADSSGAPAHEGAPREIAHPQRERSSGDRDNPRTAALERRGKCNEPETKRQHHEEETEKPPLHSFSVIATRTGATGVPPPPTGPRCCEKAPATLPGAP